MLSVTLIHFLRAHQMYNILDVACDFVLVDLKRKSPMFTPLTDNVAF